MAASGTAAAAAAPKLYEAANCVKLRTGNTGYRRKLGTLNSTIASSNTRTRENAIPRALSGDVMRRRTSGNADKERAATAKPRSTFRTDATDRRMVMARKQ